MLYGMAAALAVAFLCALLHPGTRVTADTAPSADTAARDADRTS
ncbi:hypothetical protein KNE206_48400 [Kitasatospora sp. NE20-6]